MRSKDLSRSTEYPSLLRKVIAFVVTLALFGLALMFSMMLITVILTAGALVWGYLWWKPLGLRKQMRIHSPGAVVTESEMTEGEVIEGEVIEGEVIRIDPSDEW